MKLAVIPAALALCLGVPVSAQAQTAGEQVGARDAMRKGDILPLRDIEALIIPTMPGLQYLGAEYDREARVYRLKFIRNGRVVPVDVDARTGRQIGNSR